MYWIFAQVHQHLLECTENYLTGCRQDTHQCIDCTIITKICLSILQVLTLHLVTVERPI